MLATLQSSPHPYGGQQDACLQLWRDGGTAKGQYNINNSYSGRWMEAQQPASSPLLQHLLTELSSPSVLATLDSL